MGQHSGRFVAYYRVSTDRQGRSGLGLEAQREAVRRYLNGGRWELVAEFTEVETGKGSNALDRRPQLRAAIDACKKQKASLVIAKLDRLARNVAFVSGLMESGVDFVAADNPHANRLTVHILAAVAEHEREMISERTRAALKAAKARGVRLGSPTPHAGAKRAAETRTNAAASHAANALPVIQALKDSGLTSLRQIATALNSRGLKTRRGGEWHAKAVARALASPDRE
ncbi:MAG: recombinase family protein [Gemmatimonas sp.]